MGCATQIAIHPLPKRIFLEEKPGWFPLYCFFHIEIRVKHLNCYKIEWSSVFQEAWFLYNPFLVTMLNDDFSLGYSILENMIVQQESVLFKQDQIPLDFFFSFLFWYLFLSNTVGKNLFCLAAERKSFVLQGVCNHVR